MKAFWQASQAKFKRLWEDRKRRLKILWENRNEIYEKRVRVPLVFLWQEARDSWQKDRAFWLVSLVLSEILILLLFREDLRDWLQGFSGTSDSEDKILATLWPLLLGGPIAGAIWYWRDFDKRADLQNTQDKLLQDDLHKQVEWASDSGKVDALRIAAVYRLLEHLKRADQQNNSDRQREILEIFRSILQQEEKLQEEKRQKSSQAPAPEAQTPQAPPPAEAQKPLPPEPTPVQRAIQQIMGENIRLFKKTHWRNLTFDFVEWQNVDLSEMDLQNSRFQHADLYGANLQHAYLLMANLQHAHLQGANLQYAKLYKAKLQHAYLSWAHLQHAYLQNAQLQQADLQEANLQEANLFGANLQKANLSWANLQGAKYDAETRFPEGFDPKKAGMIEQKD